MSILLAPAPRRAPWYLRLRHWLGLCDLCERGEWIWLPLSTDPDHHTPRVFFRSRTLDQTHH